MSRTTLTNLELAVRMLRQSDGELVTLLRLPEAEVRALRADPRDDDAHAQLEASAYTQLLVALALYQGAEATPGYADATRRIALAVFGEALDGFHSQLRAELTSAFAAGADGAAQRRIAVSAYVREVGPDAIAATPPEFLDGLLTDRR